MADVQSKILVVEDDLDVAEMLNAYFHVQGYEVFTVNWGEDGVRACQTINPDLVVLDIMMPVGQEIMDPNQGRTSGVAFAQMIRNEGYETPIVCYTVLNDSQTHQMLEALGVKAIILKTEPPSSLIKVINEHLPEQEQLGLFARLFNSLFTRRR